MTIPVLGFAAFSGTGKTTLIEKLILELNNRGVDVAVIKHDAHGLKFDRDGKDSQRFVSAGAVMSWVNGPEVSAAFSGKSFSLEDNIEMIRRTADITGVRLILVEGYKTGDIDKVGMCREATGKGFTADISEFVAVVTDCDISTCCTATVSSNSVGSTDHTDIISTCGNAGAPVATFGFDEADKLADWIIENYCR